MVDKPGARRTITAQERIDIRRWRLMGLRHVDISQKLGRDRRTIAKIVLAHGLDRPADAAELAWLELWDEFRTLKALLENSALNLADRTRLSAQYTRLGTTLIRMGARAQSMEMTMNDDDTANAARARLLALGEEELRNEIRHLAGLEGKQSLRRDERQDASERDADPCPKPVPLARKTDPKTSRG